MKVDVGEIIAVADPEEVPEIWAMPRGRIMVEWSDGMVLYFAASDIPEWIRQLKSAKAASEKLGA